MGSSEPATVDLERPATAEIRELAAELGLSEGIDLVERLSGGLPFVAESLCRALLGGLPADVPGAVADHALRSLLAGLEPHIVEALGVLAVVGRADEELLTELVSGDVFTVLAELSLVTVTEDGLAVIEPFQTLLDLRHRWRRPVAHRTAITKAASRNRRLLAATTDEHRRSSLTEHSLFLTDDPMIRQALFLPAVQAPAVRQARPEDQDTIGELIHEWARQGELNARKCDRLLDDWLAHTAAGFHLVYGPGDQPLGMTFTPEITERAVAVIEPITQQHTGSLIDGQAGGAFIGMAVCRKGHPAAHAALLRHVLAEGIHRGRLVIATPSPHYQQLARRLGFEHPGAARHDPYDCGRESEIYHQGFITRESVAAWLDGLAAAGISPPIPADLRWCMTEVRRALENVHDSVKLAGSPLVAATGTQETLHRFLTTGIADLAAAADQPTAQAGNILHAYYLRRRRDHIGVATHLHLSRATYFRRLDHGLQAMAQRMLAAFRQE